MIVDACRLALLASATGGKRDGEGENDGDALHDDLLSFQQERGSAGLPTRLPPRAGMESPRRSVGYIEMDPEKEARLPPWASTVPADVVK